MHACNTVLRRLALVSLAAGWLGCSGAEADSDTKVRLEATALDPGEGVSLADPEACIVVGSTGSAQSSGLSEPYVTRRWRSYDAEQRIVRDISVDEEGHPLALADAANTSTYTKLDEAGRVLIRAVEAGGGELDRFDDTRDRRGNVVFHRQSRSALRDLSRSPPEEPSVSLAFINHYESTGLLQKHNRTDASFSVSYSHDASGRCEFIFDEERVEHREYDSNGRLSTRSVDPLVSEPAVEPLSKPASSVTTHRYDDQGRPISVEQDGDSFRALAIDGQPDIQTLWSYPADGSVLIEYIDFSSDTPNDRVERNGELVPAQDRREAWSSGCAAVQASIPVPEGSGCVAD
jgi:hypothetical protein